MKRIAVFVDGSNFYYTQKKLGWEVDSERLLDYCKEYGDIVEAVYYTGATNELKQRKFHDFLAYVIFFSYLCAFFGIKCIYEDFSR